jgi:hypothetical protein
MAAATINHLRLALIVWFFIGYWILNGAEFLFWPFFFALRRAFPKAPLFGHTGRSLGCRPSINRRYCNEIA